MDAELYLRAFRDEQVRLDRRLELRRVVDERTRPDARRNEPTTGAVARLTGWAARRHADARTAGEPAAPCAPA